jgi:hypothetical protein
MKTIPTLAAAVALETKVSVEVNVVVPERTVVATNAALKVTSASTATSVVSIPVRYCHRRVKAHRKCQSVFRTVSLVGHPAKVSVASPERNVASTGIADRIAFISHK